MSEFEEISESSSSSDDGSSAEKGKSSESRSESAPRFYERSESGVRSIRRDTSGDARAYLPVLEKWDPAKALKRPGMVRKGYDKGKKDYCSIVMAAPPFSGKSFLIEYLWKYIYRNYDIILFFTTSAGSGSYNFVKVEPDDVKKKYVYLYDTWIDGLIYDLMKGNDDIIKDGGEFARIFIIFDDFFSLKLLQNQEIIDLQCHFRNHGISYLMSQQDKVMVSRPTRAMCTHWILFKCNDKDRRKTYINECISTCIPESIVEASKFKTAEVLSKELWEHIVATRYAALIVSRNQHGFRNMLHWYKVDSPKGMQEEDESTVDRVDKWVAIP